jgi:hypothetical protein
MGTIKGKEDQSQLTVWDRWFVTWTLRWLWLGEFCLGPTDSLEIGMLVSVF